MYLFNNQRDIKKDVSQGLDSLCFGFSRTFDKQVVAKLIDETN